MGSRQLLAVAVLALTSVAIAQGPLYRERWADLHIERLRECVAAECVQRDDDTLADVAQRLAVDSPNPFVPAARALARLRGVDCDDAFVLRASIGAFVLPEVVDPDAAKEECRALQVTVLLPYVLPVPGRLHFEVEAFDEKGRRLFGTDFGHDLPIEDVSLGQARATVPCAELPDGHYRVRLSTILDGKGPRVNDYVLEHTFAVLRGYQTRSEAAQRAAATRAEKSEATERALLLGLALEVARAYAGEAFDGSSEAVADLVRLETALANLDADKRLLEGLETRLPTSLPTTGPETLGAVLRWPTADPAAPRRPLVLVLGAMPALDRTGRRPSWPEVRTAKWIERRCGDFGLGAALPFAFVQSPGGSVNYAKALPVAIDALHALLPTDGTTIVVAELEAAVAVCYAPKVLAGRKGLVLVGAGALSKAMLAEHAAMPMLGVPLTGHPSSQGLVFTDKASTALRQEGGKSDFALAPDRARPWVFGARSARAEIAQFVRAAARLP